MRSSMKGLTALTVLFLVSPTGLAGAHQQNADALVGEWEMVTEFEGQQIPATMKITLEDGELEGVWTSMGEEMPMHEVKIDGATLTFTREYGRSGVMLAFEGSVDGDKISGKWITEMGELPCSGERKSLP